MQGDEVAIGAMGMGTPRVVLGKFRGGPCEELQHHRECFAGGQIPSYQREVLPILLCLWLGVDSCPLKVHDCVFGVG